MKHQMVAFCDKKGAVRSMKSLDFKEARNSFYFLQTSFTNSFPNTSTVWLILSVWNLPQK